ncbi:high-potential iron-sulfur protein [Natronomonas sp. LN261]|jgi:hypothetical protein|uniref:high-potential iron-sulfur protein n=1 Tax=Natronomonas sp. LN261 TaxID=2750669 RepID=UPI0015EF61C8|nr:high-potential iron-sulfur protein [Natronomonas sp. LN261]
MSNDQDGPQEAKSTDTDSSRRRQFLQAAGGASVAALAGCLQFGGGGDSGADTEADTEAGRPDNWCIEENNVEVAEEYRTAESVDGIERDPTALSSREEAAYQCYPQGYQLCANCRFFIPSKHADEKDEDGAGACSIVEGRVRSQDWCALYQQQERLESFPSPNPLDQEGPVKAPDTDDEQKFSN